MKKFDLFKEIMNAVTGGETVVTKTIPMKEEWRARYDECVALGKKMVELEKELTAKRNFMWSTIDIETGMYGSKRVNDKTNEVEILESKDKKEDDGVVSPYPHF